MIGELYHFQYCEIYCKFHCFLFLIKHCNQGSITLYSCLNIIFVNLDKPASGKSVLTRAKGNKGPIRDNI